MNKNVKLDRKNLTLFKEKFLPDLIIERISFSSKNQFSFNLDNASLGDFKVSSSP